MASFSASRPGRSCAGEIACVRLHDFHSALAQDLQVRLRSGMVPHVDVHRRSHNDRSRGRQVQRGQKVARNALGELGENIRRCRSNQESIDGLRDRNVFDSRVDVGCPASPAAPDENIPVITFSPERAAR